MINIKSKKISRTIPLGFTMKVVCIVRARLGSTRFPNKVLKEIKQTIIEILLSRIKKIENT